MKRELITRRAALLGTLGAGGLVLSGCDQLGQNRTFARMLEAAEKLSLGGQRLVLNSSAPLAREYAKSDVSRVFKANGTTRPDTDVYKRLQMAGFADWRLQIDGLVNKPLSLSLDELRAILRQQRVFRPVVFGIAAAHVAPRVGPGAAPEASDISRERNRPSGR